jgi:hypothetical protein
MVAGSLGDGYIARSVEHGATERGTGYAPFAFSDSVEALCETYDENVGVVESAISIGGNRIARPCPTKKERRERLSRKSIP